ncbi:MAG: hypothetical protein ABI156_14400, partial [Caldimonas sp.]
MDERIDESAVPAAPFRVLLVAIGTEALHAGVAGSAYGPYTLVEAADAAAAQAACFGAHFDAVLIEADRVADTDRAATALAGTLAVADVAV